MYMHGAGSRRCRACIWKRCRIRKREQVYEIIGAFRNILIWFCGNFFHVRSLVSQSFFFFFCVRACVRVFDAPANRATCSCYWNCMNMLREQF